MFCGTGYLVVVCRSVCFSRTRPEHHNKHAPKVGNGMHRHGQWRCETSRWVLPRPADLCCMSYSHNVAAHPLSSALADGGGGQKMLSWMLLFLASGGLRRAVRCTSPADPSSSPQFSRLPPLLCNSLVRQLSQAHLLSDIMDRILYRASSVSQPSMLHAGTVPLESNHPAMYEASQPKYLLYLALGTYLGMYLGRYQTEHRLLRCTRKCHHSYAELRICSWQFK